jgi:serpin B
MTHPRRKLFTLALCLAAVMAVVLAPAWALEEEAATDTAADATAMATASNAFAWDLLDAAIARDADLADKNLFFSPASIQLALLMARQGAANNTLAEFDEVLDLSEFADDGLDVADSAAALIAQINALGEENDDVELTIANSMWAQVGYDWEMDYVLSVAEDFSAPLEALDFITDSAGAREAINAWTAEHTNDRIQDIIPEGMLDSMTRLVLVNAIYFKSPWLHTFEPYATTTGTFNVSADETMDAEMMYQEEYLRMAQLDGLALLEMPYKDMNLSMYIVLPDDVDGLADARTWLMEGNLDEAMAELNRAYVGLTMPKFKMTMEFGLSDVLKEMGLVDAFGEAADFTGMCSEAIDEGLHISAVQHKAFVDVNESGTEAAAATAIGVGVTSLPPEPTSFKADHPFMFVIRENSTGDILFIGQVVRPEYPEDDAEDEADDVDEADSVPVPGPDSSSDLLPQPAVGE